MGRRASPPKGRSKRAALTGGPRRFGEAGPAPGQGRTRFLGWALTGAVHLAVFAALL